MAMSKISKAYEHVDFFLDINLDRLQDEISKNFHQLKFKNAESLINSNCNFSFAEDFIKKLSDDEIIKLIKVTMLFEKNSSRGSVFFKEHSDFN